MATAVAAAVAANFVAGTFAYYAAYVVTYAAVSYATTKIASAVFGKPKQPTLNTGNFSQQAQARTQVVRSAIEPMRVVYGETLTSGPLVYANSTGSNKDYLHLVVALAAHEVQAIDSVYLNDVEITNDQLDGSGNVTTGRFANFVRIKKHLGTDTQTADSDLVSDDSNWTSDHRLRGIAYVYIRLKWDRDTFPTGIPNVKAIIRGKKLYDTRTDTTYYSANTALVARDYLTYLNGLNADATEINTTTCDASANTCDEFVDVTNVNDTFTADASTDILTRADETLDYKTGDRVECSTTDTLPGGLAVSTDYYYIRRSSTTFSLATSYLNALIHSAIDITDTGTGTHTVTKTGQIRYDANGVVALDQNHSSVMEDILTSAGGIVVYTQGLYSIKVATATTAETDVIDSTWLRGDVVVRPRVSRANLFNNVRGTFVDPFRSWQPTDFPAQENVIYETQDSGVSDTFTADDTTDVITVGGAGGWFTTGRQVVLETTDTLPAGLSTSTGYYVIYVSDTTLKLATTLDNALDGTQIDITDTGTGTHTIKLAESLPRNIELPFTTDATRAQRIAKIHLEKSRQGIVIELKCNLKAMNVAVWDVYPVTLSEFGWTEKEFRILEWTRTEDDGIDLVLQEESSASYTWASGNATDHDPAPDTDLAPAFTVEPPTSVSLSSGTSDLFTAGDGTVYSRIRVTWTAPADIYAKYIEVQWKLTADSDWSSRLIDSSLTEHFIAAVNDGSSYDVRLRTINEIGIPSAWATPTPTSHTVVGKTASPSDVTSLLAQQSGLNVLFKWPAITDADRAGYAIHYGPQAGFDFDDGTPISDELIARGTTITTAAIPPGDWTFGIKAYDTSGNASDNATTVNLTVTNENDVVFQYEATPFYKGTLSNMVRHWTGKLVPESQNLANATDDDDVFDYFCDNPYATCSYEAAAIDLGFDADGVRVYADITSVLGPGETTGVADPDHQIDYKDDAGSYDGFENWIIGTADFRHLKSKLVVDTSKGLPVISAFNTICDVAERTETHADQTIASGGTTVTFDQPFHSTPSITVSVSSTSSLAATYTNVTTTSVKIHVWNTTTGADVGGTATVKATGA